MGDMHADLNSRRVQLYEKLTKGDDVIPTVGTMLVSATTVHEINYLI